METTIILANCGAAPATDRQAKKSPAQFAPMPSRPNPTAARAQRRDYHHQPLTNYQQVQPRAMRWQPSSPLRATDATIVNHSEAKANDSISETLAREAPHQTVRQQLTKESNHPAITKATSIASVTTPVSTTWAALRLRERKVPRDKSCHPALKPRSARRDADAIRQHNRPNSEPGPPQSRADITKRTKSRIAQSPFGEHSQGHGERLSEPLSRTDTTINEKQIVTSLTFRTQLLHILRHFQYMFKCRILSLSEIVFNTPDKNLYSLNAHICSTMGSSPPSTSMEIKLILRGALCFAQNFIERCGCNIILWPY